MRTVPHASAPPHRLLRALVLSTAAVAVGAGAHSALDAPAGGGHAAHGAAAGGGGGLSSVLIVGLSLVLAGYFVWHAWTCTEHVRKHGSTSSVAVRTRRMTRAAPVAHGVMSALMAAMFLGVT